jgi:hypothetical protein
MAVNTPYFFAAEEVIFGSTKVQRLTNDNILIKMKQ